MTVAKVDESLPELDTDESYTLSLPADGSPGALKASTIYGAMRGLETFSQLVQFNFETEGYEIALAPWTITDDARYAHYLAADRIDPISAVLGNHRQ